MPFPDLYNSSHDEDALRQDLYGEFSRILKGDSRIKFREKPVTFDSRMGDHGLEKGFWHLITAGEPRVFDPDRACKFGWLEEVISLSLSGLVCWEYVEGSGVTRQYLWLEDYNYLVILEERVETTFLVTAFHVQQWKVRELKRKLESGVQFSA